MTGCRLDQLKPGARIGTSSLRRQAQLLHYRPDFHIEMLRGNLDTRLRKLREGQFDAIVLGRGGIAAASPGTQEITEYLSRSILVCLPLPKERSALRPAETTPSCAIC